jgi:hypothetical protein
LGFLSHNLGRSIEHLTMLRHRTFNGEGAGGDQIFFLVTNVHHKSWPQRAKLLALGVPFPISGELAPGVRSSAVAPKSEQ